MITCGVCGLVLRSALDARAHPCDDPAVREYGSPEHAEPASDEAPKAPARGTKKDRSRSGGA